MPSKCSCLGSERNIVIALVALVFILLIVHQRVSLAALFLYIIIPTFRRQQQDTYLSTMLTPIMLLVLKINTTTSMRVQSIVYPCLIMCGLHTVFPLKYPLAHRLLYILSGCCFLVIGCFILVPWSLQGFTYFAFGLLLLAVREQFIISSPSLTTTTTTAPHTSPSQQQQLVSPEKLKRTLFLELTCLAYVLPCLLADSYNTAVTPSLLNGLVGLSVVSKSKEDIVSHLFFASAVMACAVCAHWHKKRTALPLAGLIISSHYVYAAYAISSDPFCFLIKYSYQKPLIGIVFCLMFVGSIVPIFIKKKKWAIPNIIQRKWYHYLALCGFTLMLINEPEDLRHALRIALGILALLELSRHCVHTPECLRGAMNRYIHQFSDERDACIARSHIYLLVGIYIPIELLHFPLDQFSGIAALGMYDSTAAVIGTLYGRTKLARFFPTASHVVKKRSIEGFVGGIVMTSICYYMIFQRVPYLVVLLGGISELFLDEVDNLYLPLLWVTYMSAADLITG